MSLLGSNLIASIVRFVSRGKLLSPGTGSISEANGGKKQNLSDIVGNLRLTNIVQNQGINLRR